jgi:hypothetical protein
VLTGPNKGEGIRGEVSRSAAERYLHIDLRYAGWDSELRFWICLDTQLSYSKSRENSSPWVLDIVAKISCR